VKRLFIMSGIPGSGKSSIAKAIASFYQTVVCSADDGMVDDEGKYAFDPMKLPRAHRMCFKKAFDAMNDGAEVVIIDNTNLSAWEMSPYIRVGEMFDYDINIIRVTCDWNIANGRQAHGVPEGHLVRMADAFNRKDWGPFAALVITVDSGPGTKSVEIADKVCDVLGLP
jgi:predicted kinase